MSQLTKKALAASLKKLLAEKPKAFPRFCRETVYLFS